MSVASPDISVILRPNPQAISIQPITCPSPIGFPYWPFAVHVWQGDENYQGIKGEATKPTFSFHFISLLPFFVFLAFFQALDIGERESLCFSSFKP